MTTNKSKSTNDLSSYSTKKQTDFTAKEKFQNIITPRKVHSPKASLEKDLSKRVLVKGFENLDMKLKELEKKVEIKDYNIKEIEKQIQKKREILFASKQQAQIMNANIKAAQGHLYQLTKTIKVTDDDYSTIQAKLAQLIGKISSLPLQIKPQLQADRESIYNYFLQRWPNDHESLQQLFHSEDDNKVDYALVSLLIEKLVTEIVVHRIFYAKIHLNHRINQAFASVEQLLIHSNYGHWAADLRLKCARATQDIIQNGKPDVIVDEISQARTKLVDDIVKELLNIFKDDKKEIRCRIESVIEMASDLNLPMHGQEDVMAIHFLNRDDKVIPHQVKAQYRPVGKNGNRIILGITPVFLAKSVQDDEEENPESYVDNYTIVYCGKAIW